MRGLLGNGWHRFKGNAPDEYLAPPSTAKSDLAQTTGTVLVSKGQVAPLGLQWGQYLALLEDKSFVPGPRPSTVAEKNPVGTLFKEDSRRRCRQHSCVP